MMKRIFLALLVCFVFAVPTRISAQVNAELINSADILAEGSLYYLLGKYSKAADLYKKVSRNDTNYARIQRDLAYAYNEDKEDSLCANVSRHGIGLESIYTPDFYNMLGISLKEMEKYDTALKVFDEGIRLYPYSYTMHYQKGMVYYKMKKYPDAQIWFQKAIALNPYHSLSHFQLGKSCAEQGRLIPAILSYEYYLMLDPSSEKAQKVTSAIEDLVSGDYQTDPDVALEDADELDKCFTDLKDLVESKIALSPTYKNRTKINLKMVKHFQAMVDKMKYQSGTNNWWMDNYVLFFIAVREEGQFIPFTCLSLYAVAPNNPDVYKVIKKNKKKIPVFSKWAVDYVKRTMKHPASALFADPEGLDYIFYDNNMLAGAGHTTGTAKKPSGEWKYFYAKGGHLFSKGSFDSMGERDGEWIWYYNDGTVKEKCIYKNGKRDGASEVYHPNGKIHHRTTYLNDKIEGDYETYALHGGMTQKAEVKADLLDGKVEAYYSNGTKSAELYYKAGKINGENSLFTIDGKLQKKYNSLNGKRHGRTTDYYPTGKTKSEGDYKNDDRFGKWTFYWDNGQVKEECLYKDKAAREGIWKEYYRNGNLKSERVYKSGKLQGDEKLYDFDGKIFNKNTYAASKMKKSVYYDKAGKVISEFSLGKEAKTVTEYHPNGQKAALGDYEDGERVGDWKQYSDNGGWLMAKEHYRHGYLSGTRTEYFANGKESTELEYRYGMRDGYLKSYYQNGKIESEGWFVEDEREGDWYFYNERGILTSHRYYIDDDLHGFQEYFDQKGRKNEESEIKDGFLWSRSRYDSTGTVIYKYSSDNGTGKYSFSFPNGKTWLEQEYKNGYLEGTTARYTYTETKVLEATYVNGQQHGERKEYYEQSGKLYIDAHYAYGERSGKYSAVYENGNKRWEENYYNGNLDGHQQYFHENGQVQREGTWHYGNLDGEYKFYADDGSLQMIRYYENGNLLGYSYLDKDGKILPMTKFEDATGKFVAYYQNGNKSIEGEFENGRITGKMIEYYPDGKIAEDENYFYGDFEGVQKYFYKNGNLRKEANYFSGQLDGAVSLFTEDGKPVRTESYVLGSYFGNWKYYNADGTEQMTRFYYDSRTLTQTMAAVVAPAPAPKGKPAKK